MSEYERKKEIKKFSFHQNLINNIKSIYIEEKIILVPRICFRPK